MATVDKNGKSIPVGQAIEQILEEQGMSILDLATRSHLWPSVISAVIRRNDCRLKTLRKLSAGLGLKTSELIARAEKLQGD